MASVDLTSLLTGKRDIVDTWLPLAGGSGGSVRIACEYETTDCAPNKGDLVRFTRFCHPADLFPLAPGSIYPVEEVLDNDYVLLSYKSPEGWICSFMVHRFMVLCVDRHHGAVEACRDAAVTITDRLSHSPLVGTVTQTVERLPEEGLLSVGANVIRGGFGLLGRWLDGGIDTAIKDVAFATNWDGRFNPGLEGPASQEGAADENIADNNIQSEDADRSRETEEPPITLPETSLEPSSEETPLPNMPSCPITSEPMLDPGAYRSCRNPRRRKLYSTLYLLTSTILFACRAPLSRGSRWAHLRKGRYCKMVTNQRQVSSDRVHPPTQRTCPQLWATFELTRTSGRIQGKSASNCSSKTAAKSARVEGFSPRDRARRDNGNNNCRRARGQTAFRRHGNHCRYR